MTKVPPQDAGQARPTPRKRGRRTRDSLAAAVVLVNVARQAVVDYWRTDPGSVKTPI
jgi:hypothetical protein